MEKYVADKKYIFSSQKSEDYIVLNNDNETGRELAGSAKSKIMFFAANAKIDSTNDFVGVKAGKIFYQNNGEDKIICDLNDIKLRGGHNIGNILAAVAATSAYGVAPEKICEAVKNFKGVPHRLEFVREIDGVKYMNDTAATIPDAAIAGINSFSEPLILIAGGADKNLEFKEFAKVVSEKVKKVILLKGEATEKIKRELSKFPKPSFGNGIIDSEFDSMEKAVIRAKSISGPGDVVLLSPGAASFGLFLNEFDRGEKFREAVGKLT
jgi:UDP-N-acetylmuramoylalanine--D-glutamate ligase